MAKRTIEEIPAAVIRELFGDRDANIRYIERRYGVGISTLGGVLTVNGERADEAVRAIEACVDRIARNSAIGIKDVRMISDMADKGELIRADELNKSILINAKGKPVKPKSIGQADYIAAIERNDIVFAIGPAGTGKTYLAVAMAVRAFKDKQVDKIILTRPAVEAGEKLGFLPGDLGAKVDPYLRPLYDALQDTFGAEAYNKLIERGAIEIAPLAYMRGRTLSDAFIILDEAQNATREQMKMFLTRMGERSKIVVTGDITQIDLPNKRMSGLIEAVRILEEVEGIDIRELTASDVVRHELVMRIVEAYEAAEKEREAAAAIGSE